MQKSKSIKFIGYGSLLNHESLRETIEDKKFKKIIVKGYKRIFDLEIKKEGKSDILNIIKDKKGLFNGVMFNVTEDELFRLKKREDEYNFESVDVYDFKTKKKIGKALVAIDHIVGIDRDNKKPNEHYLNLCRKGAYSIGRDFGKFWDETTYTSKNEKLSDWLKSTAH